MISIIGMGDVAVKEAGDRIQSAIDESGYVFPKKKVIISLAPGDKKKRGSHFDLAMAIGVLQEDNSIAVKNLKEYGFIGELCLDGGICYPSEHRILMDRIKEKGLLLSEYPPGTKPTKYAFPKRNRLISAWSDKVVVIAPGKGSGALITEGYARKYSRKIELYEVK